MKKLFILIVAAFCACSSYSGKAAFADGSPSSDSVYKRMMKHSLEYSIDAKIEFLDQGKCRFKWEENAEPIAKSCSYVVSEKAKIPLKASQVEAELSVIEIVIDGDSKEPTFAVLTENGLYRLKTQDHNSLYRPFIKMSEAERERWPDTTP